MKAILSGRVVELPGSNSLDFLRAAFAYYKAGEVFAISRADADLQWLGLHIERRAMPEADALQGGWGRLSHRPQLSDAPAQIVFTSGTEGRPKAILLTHRNLADVVLRLNEAMQVTDEIREYIGVPVTYSFGLGRARAVAAAGGAFYIPKRFDPAEIRRMLEAGEINAISAVPSLWKIVLDMPEAIGAASAAVRWIEIGSQYMSGEDKAALARLFPQAHILQHYGLTEASRSTFLDISTQPPVDLESVGTARGVTELKLSDTGEIMIRGPHVAAGRLMEGNTLMPLTDAGGWLPTGDRGELKGDVLYYLGRRDNRINVSGVKIYAEGIEREILDMVPSAEGHISVTGAEDPLRGEVVVLGIEAASDLGEVIESAARLVLQRRGIPPAGALRVITPEHLPRTGSGKIQRKVLAALYAAQAKEAAAPDQPVAAAVVPLTDAEADLANVWQSVVGQTPIAPDQSFLDLGGDSLSSMQLGLAMEAAQYNRASISATLEGRSLREAAGHASSASATHATGATSVVDAPAAEPRMLPDQTQRTWGLNIARAVMVLSVLYSHWGPGFFLAFSLSENPGGVMNIFYRIGTPGFATIFGLGVGMFMLPVFARRRSAVLRRMRVSFLLVLAGLSLVAGARLLLDAVQGDAITPQSIAVSFYGVLAYYAIALVTAPWWLAVFTRRRNPLAALIWAIPVLVVLWHWVPFVVPDAVQQTVLELPRLMLVAGYNVFKMSALACAGMAVGLWAARQQDMAVVARQLTGLGALGTFLCLAAMIETAGGGMVASRNHSSFVSIAGQCFYVFFSLTVFGASLLLVRGWEHLGTLARGAARMMITLGGLSLPVYAFHQLVIPVRDVMVALGLGGGPALALSMGSFLVVIGFGWWRLYRMYFP